MISVENLHINSFLNPLKSLSLRNCYNPSQSSCGMKVIIILGNTGINNVGLK